MLLRLLLVVPYKGGGGGALIGNYCYSNTASGSFCCRCFYCALTYKVIAKFETFEEDLRLVNFCHKNRHAIARYIGYLANVTFNEGVRENHTGKRTSLRALNFFRQVSRSRQKTFPFNHFFQLTEGEVNALYNLYREDFLMFGYSSLPYKAVAQR